jgi:hypothetical protein
MSNVLDTQSILITMTAVTFVTSLFFMIILLTMLRQIRYSRQQIQAEFIPLPPPKRITGTMQVIAPSPKVTPLPEQWRIPIQEALPNQVVLSIEPNESPNNDQRNVQKLIEFLKTEAVQKAS